MSHFTPERQQPVAGVGFVLIVLAPCHAPCQEHLRFQESVKWLLSLHTTESISDDISKVKGLSRGRTQSPLVPSKAVALPPSPAPLAEMGI